MIFVSDETAEKIRREKRKERLREDYKFYQKCLRVLSKKRGKKKLIDYIKKEMMYIVLEY